MAALFDSYTKACGHFDGADGATAYTDPVAGAYSFVGTAQLDTAQKKFGTASLLLDGNSDYVSLPDSASWDFGTDAWTIDFWVRYASVAGSSGLFYQDTDGSNFMACQYIQSENRILLWIRSGGTNVAYTGISTVNFSADTWYHIAFFRYGNNLYLALDGDIKTTVDVTGKTFPNLTSIFRIGYSSQYEGDKYMNGWIEEFRVSKGIARWTADFTPPTEAYNGIYLDDTTTTSDQASKAFGKIIPADSITMASAINFNYGYQIKLSDSISMTDVYSRLWNIIHILDDSITLTDAYSRIWNMTHSYSDLITASEIINRASSRDLSDTSTITDRLQEWLDKNPKPTTWSAVSTGSGIWTKVASASDIWSHVSQ